MKIGESEILPKVASIRELMTSVHKISFQCERVIALWFVAYCLLLYFN